MENLNSTPFLIILIYIVLQTLFNVVVRALLVIGSFMIIKRVSKWYGWCLLIGSSMFLICYLPLAPIFSFALARNINPSQYAQLSIAIQILINLALLVFGVGFIGLTRQFNRLLLASLRKNSN